MVVIHKLTMDLEGKGGTPWIEVEQWDAYTREIRMLLCSGNIPWEVPEGAKILICYRKPDGKRGVYDALPDGNAAWKAAGNVLSITLAPQVLTTIGKVALQTQIILDEKVLHTFPVEIYVRGHVGHANDGEGESSEDYYSVTGILPAPMQAKIGQFLRVKDVNSKGNVSCVEAVDIPLEELMNEEMVREMVDSYLRENLPESGNPGQNGIGIVSITIKEV